MDDKYIAILGGLIGSSLTIIVTKVFDYFQTNQTHNLLLKKEFFLRKINVYEKFVSQMNIAHITISNMAILIKLANNENASFTDDQSRDIFSKLNDSLQVINKATQETAGAIDLYIEFNHSDKELDDVEKFWVLLGTMNQTAQEISLDYELLKNCGSEVLYQKSLIEIEEKEGLLEVDIEKMSELSKKIRIELLGKTKQLREELKKYD